MLKLAVKLTMEWIWENLACDHIRAEIMHIKDEETGKMAADLIVKEAYTKNLFKWKTLSNDPVTQTRA